MLPRVLTVAPSTAISWMSYEFFSESVGSALPMTPMVRLWLTRRLARRGTHTAKRHITRDGSAGLAEEMIMGVERGVS